MFLSLQNSVTSGNAAEIMKSIIMFQEFNLAYGYSSVVMAFFKKSTLYWWTDWYLEDKLS